jgi:hypothetical protein
MMKLPIWEIYYDDDITGDKGIYSHYSDLFKWYESLQDGKIVSKDLLQEAFTPRSLNILD